MSAFSFLKITCLLRKKMCKFLRFKSASKENSQVLQTVHHLPAGSYEPGVIKVLLFAFGMSGPLLQDSWSQGSGWIPPAVLQGASPAALTLEWRSHGPPCSGQEGPPVIQPGFIVTQSKRPITKPFREKGRGKETVRELFNGRLGRQ